MSNQHIYELIAPALTSGLTHDERTAFHAHLHACPACFDAYTEAKDADRTLLRVLSPLHPCDTLEANIIAALPKPRFIWRSPAARRAGLALAACVALAASAAIAQLALNQNLLLNPFKSLAQTSDAPSVSNVVRDLGNLSYPTTAPVTQPVESTGGHNAEVATDAPLQTERLSASRRQSERQGRVTALLNDAERFIQSDQLEQADATLRQLLIIDPKNDRAKLELSMAEDRINYRISNNIAATRGRETSRQMIQDTESIIPYSDVLVYPPDWESVSQTPLAGQSDHTKIAATVDKVQQNTSAGGQLALGGDNTFSGKMVTTNGSLTNSHDYYTAYSFTRDKLANNLNKEDATKTSSEPYDIVQVPVADISSGWRDGSNVGYGDGHGDVDGNVIPPSFNLSDLTRGRGANEKSGQTASLSDGNVPPATQPSVVANIPATAIPLHRTLPATAPAETPDQQAPAQPAQKIIRNGNITFEVASFDSASSTLSAIAAEEKGYVSSTSSEKLANGKVTGSIIVRVPPENLDRFLLKIRGIGDLKSQQVAASDVTKEYTDLESELRALRALESRLIELIKTGKGEVKDLVEAEKQLGEYRIRIEKIVGQMNYYNSLVAMATLNITAYEKDIQKPTAAAEMESIALTVQTEDVEAKYQAARDIITDAKGHILEGELQHHDAGQLAATLVADVPPEKSDLVAGQLKQLGVVAAFSRDKKQTTSGGAGTPDPKLPVDKKDARFNLSLYNLANIAPRETTSLTLAVSDVPAAYKAVLATIKKESAAEKSDIHTNPAPPPAAAPAGKILSSSMSGENAAQLANIHADVQSPLADALLQSIKSQGEVVSSASAENTDSPNVTATKRAILIHIVNVASVPARESHALQTIAQNVPDSYSKLLAAIQSAQDAGNARIINSQLRQSDPKNVAAGLSFDVKRTVLASLDKTFADAGIEFLARNISKSQDAGNTLDTKVHVDVTLTPADNLDPRRSTALVIELENVEAAVNNLRASLPADAKELDFTILKDPTGRVSAHLVIDAPLLSAPALKASIKSLGGTERGNQIVQNNQIPDTKFARERIDLTLNSAKPLIENDKTLGTTLRAALATALSALLTSLFLVLVALLFAAPFLVVALIALKLFRRKKAPA